MIAEFLFVCCSALVPLMLCVSVTLLWRMHVENSRDRASPMPLPPGSVGLPFIGETAHFALMVSKHFLENFALRPISVLIFRFSLELAPLHDVASYIEAVY